MEQKAHSVRPGLILAVLSLGGGAYALLQSLVVPALPVLQKDLHTSTSGVAWVFTSYLLAASVVTPIAGRLGDMFGKKRVLVIALWGLAAGSLLAALVSSLALMIVARTIQGLGGAIFPLAFGILRDEFPRERVAGAIALMSGILGIGGGLGIVLAGPILQSLDYHWLFWLPLAVTAIAAAAAMILVPESTLRAPGNVHWLGAILLSGWLVALLLAVSEASTWGWGSAKTIGLIVLGAVIAVAWVWAEARSRHPLVDMTMMRLGGVWTTNLAALLLGFGMYSAFILIPQFVQTPASTGYGFGASVSQAGVFLVPTTIMLLVTSPLGGRLSNVVGSKVPLVLGSAITTVAFIVLALANARWEIYVASTLLGIGIGFAFASMANLIVEAVPPGQTGVATGMNTIVRTIGGAIGAEVAASILAASVTGGEPSKHGYTITFVICAVVVAVGILASLAVPGRRVQPAHVLTVADPVATGD
ncbi:MAG TPA: MFS transporter [Gaiellaceae bacterium]|nr:MFS transporter [Gaiellaceae bacterium]